jgi:hypothetical protein
MMALNESISADTRNLGPGYQVGHSFFCPASGVTPDQAWYRRVIESEVMPLIEEYWFDMSRKAWTGPHTSTAALGFSGTAQP